MIPQMKNLERDECIFWSQEKRKCTLGRGGIFMPMPYYITTFCQKDFYNCHYFMQANKLIENRRHFSHIKESASLPLKIDAKKQRDELFSTRNNLL